MLTPNDVARVQSSFQLVVPHATLAAQLFYSRLFELDPSLRALFKTEMTEQGRKLMAMLTTVVGSLDDLQAIVVPAQALAKRHLAYGVQAAHYDTVGQALIDTLQAALKENFDESTRDSWVKTYGVLASVMKQSAYPQQNAAAAG
ncbi:MAG: globin family protein [Burkholderiaceae bacterium]|jgi:hemoglobin-like flavoprotein